MALQLLFHPYSCCQKALVALHENAGPFDEAALMGTRVVVMSARSGSDQTRSPRTDRASAPLLCQGHAGLCRAQGGADGGGA